MRLCLFKSLNMETGAKFLPARRKPPFQISSHVVNSGFSILRRGRSQGNAAANFCFNPLSREWATNPFDFFSPALLKVKSWRIFLFLGWITCDSSSFPLSLMSWNSGIPNSQTKSVRQGTCFSPSSSLWTINLALTSALTSQCYENMEEKILPWVCVITSAFCEAAEKLLSILLSILLL